MIKQALRATAIPIGKVLRSIGVPLPERVFRHLHFVGPFTVTLPDGQKMVLKSWGNRVENEMAWRGWDGHEPEERQAWLKMVANADVVLDIGANTGTFAFTAKTHSRDSQVFAFEPVQRIADRIRENVEVSGLDVEVVEMALSDELGEAPIFDPGGANAYSASLVSDFLEGDKAVYNVPVTTIDHFCEDRGIVPTAIKVDVEGLEAQVLKGARNLLSKHQTVVLCEWCGNKDSHQNAAELLYSIGLKAARIGTMEPFDLHQQNPSDEERNILIGPESLLASLK